MCNTEIFDLLSEGKYDEAVDIVIDKEVFRQYFILPIPYPFRTAYRALGLYYKCSVKGRFAQHDIMQQLSRLFVCHVRRCSFQKIDPAQSEDVKVLSQMICGALGISLPNPEDGKQWSDSQKMLDKLYEMDYIPYFMMKRAFYQTSFRDEKIEEFIKTKDWFGLEKYNGSYSGNFYRAGNCMTGVIPLDILRDTEPEFVKGYLDVPYLSDMDDDIINFYYGDSLTAPKYLKMIYW